MRRRARQRWPAAAAVAVLCIVLIGLWQWQALARFAIAQAAGAIAHVRVAFGSAQLGRHRAVFENVRVTSFRNEPIATVARIVVTYNLRDVLPGGRRLFGLESLDVERPVVTILRRPDGTLNVPVPRFRPARAGGAPLIVRARVRGGAVRIIDESSAATDGLRDQFADGIAADADLSSAGVSTYRVTLAYGERPDRLYPIVGRGTIDNARGYIDQRWTAAQLPAASAIDFAVNSPSLRVWSGDLRHVDARYFGIRINGVLQPHLAASAVFDNGRIGVAGLSQRVNVIGGPVDVYDDGVLTPGLRARIAGVSATVAGGLYGLTNPRLRVAVRGSADLSQLRNAFSQGQRLSVRGPVEFALLVEGNPRSPTTWISLHSPQMTYAGTTLERVDTLAAYDGREADIMRFQGAYGRVDLSARGRVAMREQRNAIEMLARAHSPPAGTPDVGAFLPQLPLDAAVLATATDPKAIAARGVLWGSAPSQRLDAIFDIDERGNGSIGPVEVRRGAGSLYARIVLNRTTAPSVGVADVRNFALPAENGTLNAAIVGGRIGNAIGVAGTAGLTSSLGAAALQARVALRNGTLHGGLFGRLNSEGSFGVAIGGTPRSPHLAGTVVVAGGRYRNFNVDGAAGVAYENGTLNLHDTAVAIGPLFLGVAGTVRDVLPRGPFAPQYRLAAQIHSANASALVAAVAPQKAPLLQGSIDANLVVQGAGMAPSFAGRISAPEGSINGLGFRDFAGDVTGNAGGVSVSAGHVVVGSSPIVLSATATRSGSAAFSVNAPRTDLADFNDFFDTGDTFAGTGSLALRAQTVGSRVIATNGSAAFSNARFRRVDLGDVSARWNSSGSAIATVLRFGGPTGEVAFRGTIVPATRSIDATANARRVDLATWLPMLGYNVPITGRVDATTTLAGTYPDLSIRAHAAIFGGTVGRFELERFEVTASALHGRGAIESAVLDVPSMTTVAAGTFGLRANDPLALVVTSTVPNVGDFLKRATGKNVPVSGSLSSSLHVEGTRAAPRLRDAAVLRQLRFRNVTIPRVAAEIDADRRTVEVRNGEIDLEHGRTLLAAAIPISVTATQVAAANGPISASVSAQDVELSNFVNLLPKGTQLNGRIDGRVEAGGTLASPNLNGALNLADGTFNGPMERSPITGIAAKLGFSGTRAQLQSHAFAGSGAITASAVASVANLRRPADASFTVNGRATNARLDLPAYFAGTLNGAVAMLRRPGALPSVSGDMTISKARLPLSAFLSFNKGGGSPLRLPNVAFNDLSVNAGNDVRVQSANVDIGATGAVRLGGTLDAPSLSGAFRSTGGSLSFYRSFNIERADVTFDPSGGLIPDLNAVATTFVTNPATAIRLHATGPVTQMNLALASDPPYSREQILGILVGAQQFGAVQGVASTGGSGFSASSAARTLALGQLNTAFTRNLLEPLSGSVGNAMGFTEVQITSDLQTGLGVNAVKAFGKYVTAIFRQTLGYPQTQSIALEAHPTDATGYRLTAYSSVGPTLLSLQQPEPAAASVLNVNPATSFTPISGSNGVSLSFVRRYW